MMSDTWHMFSGSHCATCQMESKSNKSLSGAYIGHVPPHDRREIQESQWECDT